MSLKQFWAFMVAAFLFTSGLAFAEGYWAGKRQTLKWLKQNASVTEVLETNCGCWNITQPDGYHFVFEEVPCGTGKATEGWQNTPYKGDQ